MVSERETPNSSVVDSSTTTGSSFHVRLDSFASA